MGNECIMLMLACMSCGAQCARVWVCERAWQRWAGLPTHSIYDIYILFHFYDICLLWWNTCDKMSLSFIIIFRNAKSAQRTACQQKIGDQTEWRFQMMMMIIILLCSILLLSTICPIPCHDHHSRPCIHPLFKWENNKNGDVTFFFSGDGDGGGTQPTRDETG